jgi:S1-C subfamily serine protease
MLSGIEAGDIIIQLGDCKINNIYSYMECLSKYNKADTTTVTIIRKGVILKKEVVF